MFETTVDKNIQMLSPDNLSMAGSGNCQHAGSHIFFGLTDRKGEILSLLTGGVSHGEIDPESQFVFRVTARDKEKPLQRVVLTGNPSDNIDYELDLTEVPESAHDTLTNSFQRKFPGHVRIKNGGTEDLSDVNFGPRT